MPPPGLLSQSIYLPIVFLGEIQLLLHTFPLAFPCQLIGSKGDLGALIPIGLTKASILKLRSP
jgi:hypothetical protein